MKDRARQTQDDNVFKSPREVDQPRDQERQRATKKMQTARPKRRCFTKRPILHADHHDENAERDEDRSRNHSRNHAVFNRREDDRRRRGDQKLNHQ